MKQPEVNVGLVGHVDHGKTTLTKALTGVWTDRHSEEIRRGISIRLGYADATFYECPSCEEPECYTTSQRCERCGSETQFLRRVSFVDSPGHETLMAVMLSGAALMDGAILVIAANEPCPQPQTAEHLMGLQILGVKNVVIAQNKVDVVSKERAKESYREIKEFVKGTIAEGAPIVPVAAHYKANLDALIQAIEERIPTPKRNPNLEARMYVARSFDVNRPGTLIEELRGGVLGGSIAQGRFKLGDEIEVSPGVRRGESYLTLQTEIVNLVSGEFQLEEARSGGLIGVGTKLDPSLTKADGLAGNLVGHVGKLPEPVSELSLEIRLFESILSATRRVRVEPLQRNELLMVSVGCAVSVGTLTDPAEGEIKLKFPVCAESGQRVAISRRIAERWRLVGYGVVR